MGVLDIWGGGAKRRAVADGERAAIEREIKLCDRDPEKVCADCTSGGESSDDEDEKRVILKGEEVFARLEIDTESRLFNSSKVPAVHFVVPTSQVDWKHDACSEREGSVQHKISLWCERQDLGQSMSCNVTSLPIDIMNIDVMRGARNNVLVLPHFVWIQDLDARTVDETLDSLVPDLMDTAVKRPGLLQKHQNLTEAKEDSFVFICSHTTRDKRCGVTAPYMRQVFERELQKHGLFRDNSDLRPQGTNVQFTNHVGGHKFAGNVQIYLKKFNTLVWLGRVTPKHIPAIVQNLIATDPPQLPFPEKVRCIRKYEW
ncbi:Apd1p KNAG_0K02050 [Huiozyma naganishii CBS 8797]|uniref:Actin patches distal protein 1 n=1 Tax=Huiozyma naganishii (strain ATCC MYA-139 / BCRC 22969 / CBS 8797 / KCTC 17520 / NBRC 10181 / NCYC 3082 / Yp74L-3) TaxID=1071383 RepID=J7SA98_HUIN7|nr:hypothetical protein KNAG_0K02050 [Kazachstania naganishii CBS 8797]CCK72569.1 hypothetical protein KNAG_0K02050 [Kazachstania naganishii CBS 8797]